MASQNEESRADIELESRGTAHQESNLANNEQVDQELGGHSLPPVDKGWAAWRLLLSAFVFESLLWGFPLSFGVFQNYYSHLPEFANKPYISVIGTVASGISYMSAPIIIPMLERLSKHRTWVIWFGWSLCISGVLASSFAQTVWQLILTQGVMYGAGFTIFYYPIIGIVNEFWVARRGMAYGLLCASSGFSGILMPFTLEALLRRYGRFVTLRSATVGLAVLTGPLIPFIRGRLPPSQHRAVSRTDKTFLKEPLFWIFTTSNLAQGLGYFFPSLYLPSYASAIGLSSRKGALLLAMMSVAQVLGQFSFGWLSDRKLSLKLLSFTAALISGSAVFTLWGLAHSYALLCVFALVYGFFGAGYTALWGRMGTAVSSDQAAAFAVFGLLNFGKGIGNVLAGPIGANIVENSIDAKTYAAGKYKAVILFTGSCMLASAASIGFTYLRHLKPVFARQ